MLAYRVILFWLPLLIGAVAFFQLPPGDAKDGELSVRGSQGPAVKGVEADGRRGTRRIPAAPSSLSTSMRAPRLARRREPRCTCRRRPGYPARDVQKAR